MIESDHRPAIIQIHRHTEFGKKSFCYDNRLSSREGFREIVDHGWNFGISWDFTSITQCIRQCRHEISMWKKSKQH